MSWPRKFLLPVIILTGLLGACESRRQLRTFTDLQSISREIRMATSEGQHVTRETIENAVRTILDGDDRDIWGNEVVYFVRNQDWVLISPGADGELDFVNTDAYFSMGPEDIRGHPGRDIVFRNGKSITYAGK